MGASSNCPTSANGINSTSHCVPAPVVILWCNWLEEGGAVTAAATCFCLAAASPIVQYYPLGRPLLHVAQCNNGGRKGDLVTEDLLIRSVNSNGDRGGIMYALTKVIKAWAMTVTNSTLRLWKWQSCQQHHSDNRWTLVAMQNHKRHLWYNCSASSCLPIFR